MENARAGALRGGNRVVKYNQGRTQHRLWMCCPNCGKKLLQIIPDARIVGAYMICRGCRKEIELNTPNSAGDLKKI